MVVLDSIIYELQRAGGISEVFSSVFQHLINDESLDFRVLSGPSMDFDCIPSLRPHNNRRVNERGPLFLRRYADAKVPKGSKVFHSSYLRVAQGKYVKNITTVHDFIYDKFDAGAARVVHRKQRNHAVRNSDAIICVSEHTKSDFLEYYPDINERLIKVIYNGVNPLFYKRKNEREVLLEGAPYLLYVGGRGAHKNFRVCLDILLHQRAIGKELKLLVVGGGRFSSAEKNVISGLGLSTRVKHAGLVTNDSLATLYQNAFALVFPSFYEGFGIPPLEAMASECPVICSTGGSIPEVVGDCGVYFDPYCSDSAIDACEQLSDEHLRSSIIKRGFERSKSFSWKNTGRETTQLYRELL